MSASGVSQATQRRSSTGPATSRSAAPRAAAHPEDAHRRVALGAILDTAQPAIEPAPPQREKILGEIAVDRGLFAEIDLARIAQRAVAMGPWPEDQLHRPTLLSGEPL